MVYFIDPIQSWQQRIFPIGRYYLEDGRKMWLVLFIAIVEEEVIDEM